MVDTTPFPEWTGTDGGESDGVWIDRYVSKDYKLDLWESSTSEIVYVGVLIAAFGEIFATIGMIFLKKADVLEGEKPLLRRRYFWKGLGLVLLNTMGCNTISYALCPLTLIAPLAALQVVLSNIFAHYGCFVLEKETITCKIKIANGMIMTGIVLTALWGPQGDGETLSLDEMIESVSSTKFLCFLGPTIALLALCLTTIIAEVEMGAGQKSLTCATGAAATTCLSTVCFKAFSICVRRTIEGHETLTRLQAWFFLVAAVGGAPLGFWLLNATVANGPVVVGIPTFQALQGVFLIVCGGLFYNEFDKPVSFLFYIGVAASLGGVFFLTTLIEQAKKQAAVIVEHVRRSSRRVSHDDTMLLALQEQVRKQNEQADFAAAPWPDDAKCIGASWRDDGSDGSWPTTVMYTAESDTPRSSFQQDL